jgi:uncharacterized membrane protein
MIGTIHIVFAIAALAIGAAVIFRPKGGIGHRTLGYFYVIFLFSVNVSALLVYEESVGMGPFHILAIISLVTLISGFIPVFLRRPETSWLNFHAYFISWSYVGLVAAGVAQLVTMWFSLPAEVTVGLPSVLVVIVGGVLIHTRVPQIIAKRSVKHT